MIEGVPASCFNYRDGIMKILTGGLFAVVEHDIKNIELWKPSASS